MNGWLITWGVWHLLGLGYALGKDGENLPDSEARYSFARTFIRVLISVGLLYMGGAFSH